MRPPITPNDVLLLRLWQYSKERFPLVSHGLMTLAFSSSAVSASALLRGGESLPGWEQYVVAFGLCLFTFIQLRIIDEHKDAEDDAQYRPYRPVPRGLVTLEELRNVFIVCAVYQVFLALCLVPEMLWLLGAVWAYLLLMGQEFFAKAWLHRHPVVLLLTHMAILPLMDLMATGCDWLMANQPPPPSGLATFLLLSFANGLVFEVGRKIRSPYDEEQGVATYSSLWGPVAACGVWLFALFLAGCGFGGTLLQFPMEPDPWLASVPALLITVGALLVRQFLKSQVTGSGKPLERFSAVWIVMTSVCVGVVPLVFWVLAQQGG
jgi:4-hydroxybenzoate polyprenyltransferase